MKLEQALNDVRGMIRCIKIGERKPNQLEYMELGGFCRDLDFGTSPPDWNLDESKLPKLLSVANSDAYALEAARILIEMHLGDRRPLPKPLAEFVMEWLDEPPKPGKKKENPTIRARNEFLAVLVAYLDKHTDLHVSSRSEKAKKTASQWVSEIYQEETRVFIDPGTVKKAHTNHRPSWDKSPEQ